MMIYQGMKGKLKLLKMINSSDKKFLKIKKIIMMVVVVMMMKIMGNKRRKIITMLIIINKTIKWMNKMIKMKKL